MTRLRSFWLRSFWLSAVGSLALLPAGLSGQKADGANAPPAIVTPFQRPGEGIEQSRTNAIDYLLKPVEPERLARTIARVRVSARTPGAAARRANACPTGSRGTTGCSCATATRSKFVRASSVACVLAHGDYTRVGTIDGRSRLVHRSLRDWKQRLPPDTF